MGKEDTLLQLAKTDREKTGRQLCALLTLDDAFTSDKARKSLQKNAFALMKLHCYKDAAAVFLLADPPFIKEACSVLNRQFNNPLYALLVTRLAEQRLRQRCIDAAMRNNASSGSTNSSTNSSTGFVAGAVTSTALGAVSRQLLRTDILPALLQECKNSSLPALQEEEIARASQTSATVSSSLGATAAAAAAAALSATAYNSSSNNICSSNYNNLDAAVLALVCALWLQSPAVLRDTFKQRSNRYVLVDSCCCASVGVGAGADVGEKLDALLRMEVIITIFLLNLMLNICFMLMLISSIIFR